MGCLSSKLLSKPTSQLQTVSTEKALQNPLIISCLAQYLEKPDLLTARAVNQQWRDVLTPFLAETCQIVFYWNNQQKLFDRGPSKDNPFPTDKYLSRFNDFLEETNNAKFPCKNFTILAFASSELDQDIQRFFTIQGKHIQTLEITTLLLPTRVEFYNLLYNLLPRLESLRIFLGKFGDSEKDERLLDKNFYKPKDLSLPALKKFRWDCFDENILTDILRSAPNLIEVTFKNQSYLKLVVKCDKAFAIKTLFVSNQEDSSSDIIKFANLNPKLEKLIIHWYTKPLDGNQSRVLRRSLFTLIHSSRKTLTHLDLDNFTKSEYTDWHGLNFPQLLKLQKFSLAVNYNQFVLPYGIILSKAFPNLYTLDLSRIGTRGDRLIPNFTTSFRHAGSLLTVKNLEISVEKGELWLQQLRSNLCPNFSCLVIHVSLSHQKLPTMLKYVFEHWQQLVSLELKYLHYSSCDLDPVLLGLEQRVVGELSQKFENGAELETLGHATRNGPCILSMKKLKSFKFDFHRDVLPSPDPMPFPGKPLVFSRLSWFLGFGLMPDLEILVYIHENHLIFVPGLRELLSIRPFAKFYNRENGRPIVI